MATFMGERVRDRMYPITCGVAAGCEKNYGGGKKGVSPKTKTGKSPSKSTSELSRYGN